jgi:hypothetical protein
MATYTVRYSDRARAVKASLPATQRAALEGLERKLATNPYGHGAVSNGDNSWSASFTGGMITYVVSNRYLTINVIAVVAV